MKCECRMVTLRQYAPVVDTHYIRHTKTACVPHDKFTGGEPVSEIEPRKSTALQHWADVAMWQAPEHDDPQHPKVYVQSMTADPLGVMAMVNGQYTGKYYTDPGQVSDDERREAWEAATVSKLSKAPLEWIQMAISFENVTRAFTHQLVRTRMGGYAQESMRFAVKGDLNNSVKLPPSLNGTSGGQPLGAEDGKAEWQRNVWDEAVAQIEQAYMHLVDSGMPAEDARGLLPTNVLTRIHMHVDMGTLLGLAGMRLCTQAQFEWREVFAQLVQALRNVVPEDYPDRWQYELMAQSFRPVCFGAGKCVMKAKSDRACAIRAQVDDMEDKGVPSSEWERDDDGKGHFLHEGWRMLTIEPVQWLADPTAARVAP